MCFILQIKDSSWREGAVGNTSAIQFKGVDQNKMMLIFIDIFHTNYIFFDRTSFLPLCIEIRVMFCPLETSELLNVEYIISS